MPRLQDGTAGRMRRQSTQYYSRSGSVTGPSGADWRLAGKIASAMRSCRRLPPGCIPGTLFGGHGRASAKPSAVHSTADRRRRAEGRRWHSNPRLPI